MKILLFFAGYCLVETDIYLRNKWLLSVNNPSKILYLPSHSKATHSMHLYVESRFCLGHVF